MNRPELLRAALQRDADDVTEALKARYAAYRDPDTQLVRDAEMYSLMAGGKRIRPFLILEFCAAFGGNRRDAMPFAEALEMLHTFSLIHDDLPCMDDDDLRRGKPTSHKVFGEATALLAGDSLSLRAVETAMANPFVPKETALTAALELSRAAGSEGMVGGQIIDMRGEKEDLDFDTLLSLHSKKTGAIIRVSALLGCLAAGLSPEAPETQAATQYASDIGLAFQIVDDILDVTASAEQLGKSVGGDSAHHKTTFMTFMSVAEAHDYAAKLTRHAQEVLAPFDGCGLLCDLAQYLLERKN